MITDAINDFMRHCNPNKITKIIAERNIIELQDTLLEELYKLCVLETHHSLNTVKLIECLMPYLYSCSQEHDHKYISRYVYILCTMTGDLNIFRILINLHNFDIGFINTAYNGGNNKNLIDSFISRIANREKIPGEHKILIKKIEMLLDYGAEYNEKYDLATYYISRHSRAKL